METYCCIRYKYSFLFREIIEFQNRFDVFYHICYYSLSNQLWNTTITKNNDIVVWSISIDKVR